MVEFDTSLASYLLTFVFALSGYRKVRQFQAIIRDDRFLASLNGDKRLYLAALITFELILSTLLAIRNFYDLAIFLFGVLTILAFTLYLIITLIKKPADKCFCFGISNKSIESSIKRNVLIVSTCLILFIAEYLLKSIIHI